MTVYVDSPRHYPGQIVRWSHMWADSLEELHAMADRIGLRRAWFQDDPRLKHYDVQPGKRTRAIRAGAIELELRTWLHLGRP